MLEWILISLCSVYFVYPSAQPEYLNVMIVESLNLYSYLD